MSQIRESISNVNKTMKNKISAMGMAVALWTRHWTPERESSGFKTPLSHCVVLFHDFFIQACLKSRVCFFASTWSHLLLVYEC